MRIAALEEALQKAFNNPGIHTYSSRYTGGYFGQSRDVGYGGH